MTGRRFYSRERVAYVDRGTIVVAPIAPDVAVFEVERRVAAVTARHAPLDGRCV